MQSPHSILIAITIAGAAVLFSGCTSVADAPAATPAPSNSAVVSDVFAMKVGDCLDDGDSVEGDDIVTRVPIVKCSLSHDSEVIKGITLKGSDSAYPGSDAVTKTADRRCNAPYETFTGATLKTTTLDYTYYFPSAASWKTGDRQILCVVYNPDGRVAGSLRGKGPAYPKS